MPNLALWHQGNPVFEWLQPRGWKWAGSLCGPAPCLPSAAAERWSDLGGEGGERGRVHLCHAEFKQTHGYFADAVYIFTEICDFRHVSEPKNGCCWLHCLETLTEAKMWENTATKNNFLQQCLPPTCTVGASTVIHGHSRRVHRRLRLLAASPIKMIFQQMSSDDMGVLENCAPGGLCLFCSLLNESEVSECVSDISTLSSLVL